MTALDEYQRLEAAAIWRDGPHEQARNVFVSIGSATLVITTPADAALAHWSLPAVERVNPGSLPAVYRPSPEAPETLEVTEPEMVAAIERVRRAVGQGQPREGRLRGGLIIGVLAAFGALAAFWAPGAIKAQIAGLLPEAARDAIGSELMLEIQRVAGSPCDEPEGQTALDRLAAKVAPGVSVFVMPSAIETTASLPGGTVLVGRGVVEDHETPFVAAGYLAAADLGRTTRDPMLSVLEVATLPEAAKLLTTGSLPPRVIAAHAENLARGTAPRPDDASLITRFANLEIPVAPYAYAVDISGETVSGLIEADLLPVAEAVPPIADLDWVALQGICGE